MSTVLITGCSSGFGKATAELFLERGWKVIATMRTPAASTIEGPVDRLRILPLDVADAHSIQNAVGEAKGAFGGVDALVNNCWHRHLRAAGNDVDGRHQRAVRDQHVPALSR